MAEKSITISNFSGGIGDQEKRGLVGSARLMKNLNPHEDDAYLTPTPKLAKVSGSTVTGLVKWAVDASPWATDRYFYDDGGKIYKETSGGTWSTERTVSGGAGQGLAVYSRGLYYPTTTTLGRYWPLDNSPAFSDDFLSDGTTNIDQSGGGTGATDYTTQTSITETATHRQTFTPTLDPIKAIIIDVDVVGTGNWTLTVHDSNNNSLGSATIANGSMGTGDRTFTFTTALRPIIGNEYHFHVTSTVADGGVDTSTNNDLEAAEFSTVFGILISDADFHPAIEFLNLLVIGNERYLAVWDEATYNPNRLVFAPGFKTRALVKVDEYIVAGCWRGANIDSTELGRIYIWDGIADTFNYVQDVPVGLVNALANHNNNLLGVYGSNGEIYQGTDEFKQLWHVPKLGRGRKIEVLPGAVTNWQGQTMIGIGANTDDSTGLEQGVYALGSQDSDHPDVFTLAHTISTGTTQGTGLEIGCVAAFGADMYVGWKDSSTYGVDKVSKSSNANTSGSYESLIIDAGNPHKEKLAYDVVVEFEDLESGESITPKYQLDRSGSFTNGTTISTVGANRASVLLNRRFKEAEIGFNFGTSATFPKIISVQFNYNDLAEEGRSDR